MATIQPFERGIHIRDNFKNRHESLENYIKRYARQDISHHLAQCFVLAEEDQQIRGYYTLSNYSVEIGDWDIALAKKYNLVKYPVILCTLIGRLAVHSDYEGNGYGRKLLIHSLYTALEASKRVASFAVVVDSIDQEAKNFYLKFGFIPFSFKPNQLFLPIESIDRMLKSSISKIKDKG